MISKREKKYDRIKKGLAMRKRQIKKRLRDMNQPELCLEGNNYGDFTSLIPMKNDRVYLRSGCSCVITVDEIVPNEFLSLLISDCILQYGSVTGYLESISYDDSYKQKLISKVGKNY